MNKEDVMRTLKIEVAKLNKKGIRRECEPEMSSYREANEDLYRMIGIMR